MIGVHLSAVNTFSSQVSIPFDISRMPSGYYLTRPCVKFKPQTPVVVQKEQAASLLLYGFVFVNVHFLYTPSLRTLLLSCILFFI